MENTYDLNQIKNAYRKLKSYIYYDNFFVYLRDQIAEFEADQAVFLEKLESLLKYLNDPSNNEVYYQTLLEQIDTTIVAKKYKTEIEDDDFVITNSFTSAKYEVERVNYLINAPVEIHIISILWILEDGYLLMRDYAKNNYAYKLEIDSNTKKVVDGLRLFKPYFEQYQIWRDNAIEKAQHFLKEETDVLIIGIDVKEYFYNIIFDDETKRKLFANISDRKKEIVDEDPNLFLTEKIFEIHQKYSKKMPVEKQNSTIPIGLLSSGILSNWYLKDLDNEIIDGLSPAYYGRYVDDILIVLANAKIPSKKDVNDKTKSSIDRVFEKFFIDRKILKVAENKEDESILDPCKPKSITYCSYKLEQIKIQKEKISIHAFNSKESKAVLEKFKKNIQKNSSAFWLLPNENQINDDFDESVYELSYSDTVNKLRSISEVKLSKYGASIFLAKKIKVSLMSDNQSDEKTTEQILTFFKGRMNLEFISIWEKVLTYFVITNEFNSFYYFIRETIECIDRIDFVGETKDKTICSKIKESYLLYLINSISIALSLNASFIYTDYLSEKIRNLKIKWYKKKIFEEITKRIENYKKTNLFRHNYVVQPLLNFISDDGSKIDFTKHNVDIYYKKSLDSFKLEYSPRYVYYFEFTHFYIFEKLVADSKKIKKTVRDSEVNIESLFLVKNENNTVSNLILDRSFDNFFETNHLKRNPHKYEKEQYTQKQKEKLKSKYYIQIQKEIHSDSIQYDFIKASDNFQKEKIRIAVANIKVDKQNIEASFNSRPNTSKIRRKEFIEILNETERNKADFLILPELSVPFSWLPLLADEARRKERSIICGLEYITIDNICYNFTATILPVDHSGIKDCIIVLRLKNHYAPHEEKFINNHRKIVPKSKPYTYNKFIWNKIHFAVYNCFELADINHRTIFRSEVDLLFASEYNRDINYFSNIVDTISRDVHCFFIQSNSSDFGDSRITQPSRTETKDILKLKGGVNNVILCGDLDLKSLREFQSKKITGQNGILYKITPPDYDHSKAEERLKGL